MPTVPAHMLIGAAVWRLAAREPRPDWRAAPLASAAVAAAAAALPDLDVFLVRWLPPNQMFAHRGITHGLPAAALLGLVAAWLVRPEGGLASRFPVRWLVFSAAVASHGLLDSMLCGRGDGAMLLAPFSSERILLLARPVPFVDFRALDLGDALRTVGLEVLLLGPLFLAMWTAHRLVGLMARAVMLTAIAGCATAWFWYFAA